MARIGRQKPDRRFGAHGGKAAVSVRHGIADYAVDDARALRVAPGEIDYDLGAAHFDGDVDIHVVGATEICAHQIGEHW